MKSMFKRGFSLVELLIVVAIIGLVAALVTPRLCKVEAASLGGKGPGVYPETVSITNKITHSVGVTTTAVLGSAISLNGVESLGFQLTASGSAAGTGHLIFLFARSIDNTNYETVPQLQWDCTQAGATTNTFYTNFVPALIGPAAWIRCVLATNADAACDATNVILKVSKKLL